MNLNDSSLLLPSAAEIQQELLRRSIEAEGAARLNDIESSRKRCESLAGFIREAWHVVQSGPYVHGWHIDAICAHLEAISRGKFLAMGLENRLLINVPPGTMKSLLTSVFWPAWEWGPGGQPWQSYLTTSFAERFARRDSRRHRDLVQSDWFQARWPLPLVRDGEMSFANARGGYREAVPISSLTGGRASRVIEDDPNSTESAESEAERETANRIHRESVTERLSDKQKDAIVVIQQRLHEMDVSGLILSLKLPYQHVMLPMEFEPERRCKTAIFEDPRTQDGELLFPERFPRETVERDKLALGTYAVAGQYQQRPAPRGGLMFKRHWFVAVSAAPLGTKWVRGWDLAASTEAGSAYTAGVKVGRQPNGRWIVAHAMHERTTTPGLLVKFWADQDGHGCVIDLPQDPGQAGKPIWEDEMILMEDGSRRRLKELVSGDRIIAMDGKPHRILNVYEQGNLETLRLATESGREVVAAKGHPFLTPEGWVEAGRLEIGDVLGLMSKAATVPVERQRSASEFRLAGYFVGDGAVGRAVKAGRTGSCHAEFCCWNDEQMDDFRTCVASIGGQVVHRKREGTYGTKGLQPWLRDTGLAGATAYTKRVPSWVFTASAELIAQFIGAYFACDGSVSKDGGEVVFYSVSKGLLVDVQHLLLRLGIGATIKTKLGKYRETRHVSHMLRLRQQDDAYRRFANRVPVHHSLKRVRLQDMLAVSRYRRFDEPFLPDRVIAIDRGGLRQCRCLELADGAGSFTANDFVVHNTQVRDLINTLAGFVALARRETGDKITRAQPVAAQAEAGNVDYIIGDWNEAFFSELEKFPTGQYKDMVDALSGAFGRLVMTPGGGVAVPIVVTAYRPAFGDHPGV